MELIDLTAISPIDGRYRSKLSGLSEYFSEFALMRYRVLVEIEYFIALCRLPLPPLSEIDLEKTKALRDIYHSFSVEDARTIKKTELTTNHDVKAVEYFLKARFEQLGLGAYKEFIHFGLTSQDINNVAMPLAMKEANTALIRPAFQQLFEHVTALALQWKNVPMLARTHGQPASPTRLGKEFYVFAERISKQLNQLDQIPFSAKFGGATGNFNAHYVAYPLIGWVDFANNLIEGKLGLKRQQTTTQIEHYDDAAAYFDAMKRLNTILLDFCRDVWMYVMLDYFKQRIKAGEVGSSAMPHKVNPIDFENAEGNLGLANAILTHLSEKLPVSRLQRDLTDSTVTRNIGVPLAHTWLALQSIEKGLGKLLLNEEKIKLDLEANWAVVAEAIQTILRREQVEGAYELLKDLTRTNQGINKNTLQQFVAGLKLPDAVKNELYALSPETYTGTDLLKHLK